MNKLLVVSSVHEAQAALACRREFEWIRLAFDANSRVQVIFDSQCTGGQIIAYLGQTKPKVVHFSGHGNDFGDILVKNDQNTAVAISPGDLAEGFQYGYGEVRCVFLNACYSHEAAIKCAEFVDCVIGCIRAVADQDAVLFSKHFYERLAIGRSVHDSFVYAQTILAAEGRDWENYYLISRESVDPKNVVIFPDYKVKAEFVMEKHRPSRDGENYDIILSVHNGDDLTSVVYQLNHEDYDNEYIEVLQAEDDRFGCDFTTYGDIPIRVMLWKGKSGICKRYQLRELLNSEYPNPSVAIARALRQINEN